MPINITGSWVLSGGLTGSLYGTASFSDFAQSASYFSGSITNAVSSSYALTSTSATSASRITILSDTTNQPYYIPFVNNVANGTDVVKIAGGTSALKYNPFTNSITASNFQGTSSFAVTASYAIASTGLSNPYTGDAVISGSLTIKQGNTNEVLVISASNIGYPKFNIRGNESTGLGGGQLTFEKPYAFTTLQVGQPLGQLSWGQQYNLSQFATILVTKAGNGTSLMKFSSTTGSWDFQLSSGSSIDLFQDTILSSYKVLTLTPTHPLRTTNVPTGSFAVSSSVPPKPYFWDGITWNSLY